MSIVFDEKTRLEIIRRITGDQLTRLRNCQDSTKMYTEIEYIYNLTFQSEEFLQLNKGIFTKWLPPRLRANIHE